MDKREAMEQLFGAILETGADFSYNDGTVVVGGLTFTCRDEHIVVSMGPVTNYFQYKTLSYISGRWDGLCIADTHVGVFGNYKVID